jgi:hypothetical protein
VLLALTAAACVLAFEVVRRLRPLRPQFGLKAQLPPQGAAA